MPTFGKVGQQTFKDGKNLRALEKMKSEEKKKKKKKKKYLSRDEFYKNRENVKKLNEKAKRNYNTPDVSEYL